MVAQTKVSSDGCFMNAGGDFLAMPCAERNFLPDLVMCKNTINQLDDIIRLRLLISGRLIKDLGALMLSFDHWAGSPPVCRRARPTVRR